MLDAMRKASGKPIAHKIVPRRPGDVATCYADPTLVNIFCFIFIYKHNNIIII